MTFRQTALTAEQKLHALSYRFYQRQPWDKPKTGDYYTTSRADLELYQIVNVHAGVISTRRCNGADQGIEAEWREAEFLDGDTFGYARVWVPDWIFTEAGRCLP